MDTLFADVSYFQRVVDDTYPYKVLSIRSNDGMFRDPAFSENYQWCVRAVNEGRLEFFIVYAYWRPNWQQTTMTLIEMVEQEGGPHPGMVAMIDVESGGNPDGNQSDGINHMFWTLAEWLGSKLRVIGYANYADFRTMWPVRPDGLRIIGAGYGRNPNLDGQIAHQYTDGQGYGHGLPEGAPPFGNCDMNSAHGLTPREFAEQCGISSEWINTVAMVTSLVDPTVTMTPEEALGFIDYHANKTYNEHGALLKEIADSLKRLVAIAEQQTSKGK